MPPTNMQTAKRARKSAISVTRQVRYRPTGEESFSALLRRLMKARRMSAPRLPDRSWLDSAYVWRLTREEADILHRRVTDGAFVIQAETRSSSLDWDSGSPWMRWTSSYSRRAARRWCDERS